MTYYSSSRGIEFLNKNTKFKWCTIHPSQLNPNMCVAAVAPPSASNKNYSVLNSFTYVPEAHRFIHQPRTFNKYLTDGKKLIKFQPAVQYDLKGITVNFPTFIRYLNNTTFLTIEGSASLEGSLLLRQINGINLVLSNLDQLSVNFQKARDDFISSLKITEYLHGSHPTLTIGSSLTDKLLMASISVNLTPNNPNTFTITSNYSPPEFANSYFLNLENRLILETNMSYKFVGKLTIINSKLPITHHWLKTSAIIGGSVFTAAAIIFIIPTSGASLIGTTVAVGLSL